MNKLVAIEGCELEFNSGKGDIDIDTEASKIVKVNKRGVYFGEIKIVISNFTSDIVPSWIDRSGHAEAKIKPTSQKLSSNKLKVIREGDMTEMITIDGKILTPQGPQPSTDQVIVRISKAGQLKVKAE